MKIISILVGIFFIAILGMAFYRDVQIDKQNPSDLRNRVVGARLIEDGKSPYFYKWKAADGMRYYDPAGFDSLPFSNITATPFFHHLMRPIADVPERQLSRIWLMVVYSMLLLALLFFIWLAPDMVRKNLVVIAASLFLLTEGWQMSIGNGQNYLFIPFFAMLFYWCIIQPKKLIWAFAAGLFAIALVLIRPNCIVFFVPFLLLIKKYDRRYLLALCIPVLALLTWTAANRQERFLWNDYRVQVMAQIKMHQGQPVTLQKNEMGPRYAQWEGIDTIEMKKESLRYPVKLHSENGNFFLLYNRIFNTRISVPALNILSGITILLLAAFFYYKHTGENIPTLAEAAIMGFCLYMVSDLYSPVYRHQYYTVQWMFPLLLAVSFFKPSFRWPYLLIWAGLLLNCLNISFIKMEHTCGELLLLAGLIALIYQRQLFVQAGKD